MRLKKRLDCPAILENKVKFCSRCQQSKPDSDFDRRGKILKCWCRECWRLHYNDKARIQARERHAARKAKALSEYGTVCQRCGISDPDVLTIDHINNDGASHRKELQASQNSKIGSSKVYQWLEKNGYPNGFTVLCFNCNIKKHLEYSRGLSKYR